MVISMAVLTIRKEKSGQVFELLNKFVTEEKAKPGVMRVYYKRAVDNDDTILLCTEYENRKSFEASDQEPQQEGHVGFELRPYLLKAFYGNFE
jgi:quinol monooxygenase YgiN